MKGDCYSENFWINDKDKKEITGITLSFKDKKTYDAFMKIEKGIHLVFQQRNRGL